MLIACTKVLIFSEATKPFVLFYSENIEIEEIRHRDIRPDVQTFLTSEIGQRDIEIIIFPQIPQIFLNIEKHKSHEKGFFYLPAALRIIYANYSLIIRFFFEHESHELDALGSAACVVKRSK
jgi:hypothetical protein